MLMAVLVSSSVGFSQNDPSATACEKLADRLTTILSKLDRELVKLPDENFPMLEEQLQAISSLLNDLVSSLETPSGMDKEGPTAKEQAIKLDLMLHRLVAMLERIARANNPDSTPTQMKARDTIGDLRGWVDGYIAGVTAKMGPVEARRYEEMARTLLADVGEHLARAVAHVRSKDEEPSRIEVIIRHITGQLLLLDRFIVRTFGAPARMPVPHRP